jgi:type VI secretion system protein ImpK
MPDAATLRTRALELKSRFERAAADDGFSAADVEDAVFAMVAFMDQTILNGRGAARDAWRANPLELELYRRQVAGEEFFDRLARLQQERESRIEALEVYCCCLAFGFTGRYVLSPPEHLVSMLEELRRDISAVRGARPGPLAPNARHRAERVEEEAHGMPWYLPVAFGLASTLLAFLIVWLFARVGAGNAAAAVRSLIR